MYRKEGRLRRKAKQRKKKRIQEADQKFMQIFIR